jgi:hypothetical protein
MVDVAGIQDRETLEAWLKGRSREDAICIAHRAAMRVAPLFWGRLGGDWALKRGLTPLGSLWPLLISGVARNYSSPEFEAAAAVSGIAFDIAADAAAAVIYAVDAAQIAAYATLAAADAVTIDARNAGAASDYAEHLQNVRMDCATLEAGDDPFTLPLWDGPAPERIADAWARTRAEWAKAGGPVWAFWTQFYENALAGRPQDWALLQEIALIPAEDWQGGPDRVHPIIEGMLLDRRRSGPESVLDSAIMRAALVDFTFDDMARLMRMVPFDEDTRHLKDPERLQSFLDDAEELRDSLEAFSLAIAANTGVQGAPLVATYLDSYQLELSKARQTQHLRVGLLLERGAMLESLSLDDGYRNGLGGPMAGEFDRLIRRMRDLTARHFAPTLLRMKPRETLVLAPDEDIRKLLSKLEQGIAAVRKVDGDRAIPLDPLDLAVFDDMVRRLRNIVHAIEAAETPQTKRELRENFQKEAASTTATVGRYWLRASTAAGKVGEGVDKVVKSHKRIEALEAFVRWVGELWNSIGGGGPPAG